MPEEIENRVSYWVMTTKIQMQGMIPNSGRNSLYVWLVLKRALQYASWNQSFAGPKCDSGECCIGSGFEC